MLAGSDLAWCRSRSSRSGACTSARRCAGAKSRARPRCPPQDSGRWSSAAWRSTTSSRVASVISFAPLAPGRRARARRARARERLPRQGIRRHRSRRLPRDLAPVRGEHGVAAADRPRRARSPRRPGPRSRRVSHLHPKQGPGASRPAWPAPPDRTGHRKVSPTRSGVCARSASEASAWRSGACGRSRPGSSRARSGSSLLVRRGDFHHCRRQSRGRDSRVARLHRDVPVARGVRACALRRRNRRGARVLILLRGLVRPDAACGGTLLTRRAIHTFRANTPSRTLLGEPGDV